VYNPCVRSRKRDAGRLEPAVEGVDVLRGDVSSAPPKRPSSNTYLGIIMPMLEIADTIRKARLDAHLSQVELASRAGTSQPALARYEAGTTIPALPTLERLLSACGRQLRIEAPPLTENPHATSVRGQLGPFAKRLRHRRRGILDSARKRGITRVRVFGSAARGKAKAGSDLDLLVELKPGRTLVDLAGFRRDVSDLLDLPVDVATPDMLKPRLRDEVLEEALPL
jgi:uncharacterized protein